uniref:Uncharacterized protein n=1 Tax=Spongospora subterranea TaxID=70186 RepID=A0A0H5RT88_9EUKA|eukprot:CRZ11949.1 hypothetical protein [Spongospora subterranea]
MGYQNCRFSNFSLLSACMVVYLFVVGSDAMASSWYKRSLPEPSGIAISSIVDRQVFHRGLKDGYMERLLFVSKYSEFEHCRGFSGEIQQFRPQGEPNIVV